MYPRQDGMAGVSSTLFGGNHTLIFSKHLGNHSLKCLFQVGISAISLVPTMQLEAMQK